MTHFQKPHLNSHMIRIRSSPLHSQRIELINSLDPYEQSMFKNIKSILVIINRLCTNKLHSWIPIDLLKWEIELHSSNSFIFCALIHFNCSHRSLEGLIIEFYTNDRTITHLDNNSNDGIYKLNVFYRVTIVRWIFQFSQWTAWMKSYRQLIDYCKKTASLRSTVDNSSFEQNKISGKHRFSNMFSCWTNFYCSIFH